MERRPKDQPTAVDRRRAAKDTMGPNVRTEVVSKAAFAARQRLRSPAASLAELEEAVGVPPHLRRSRPVVKTELPLSLVQARLRARLLRSSMELDD